MKNSKRIAIIVTVLLGMTAKGASFECKYSKGWDRPANANAIKLAKVLKVKSCNSAKFVKFVKEGKHTMSKLVRNSNGGVKDIKFN